MNSWHIRPLYTDSVEGSTDSVELYGLRYGGHLRIRSPHTTSVGVLCISYCTPYNSSCYPNMLIYKVLFTNHPTLI